MALSCSGLYLGACLVLLLCEGALGGSAFMHVHNVYKWRDSGGQQNGVLLFVVAAACSLRSGSVLLQPGFLMWRSCCCKQAGLAWNALSQDFSVAGLGAA